MTSALAEEAISYIRKLRTGDGVWIAMGDSVPFIKESMGNQIYTT